MKKIKYFKLFSNEKTIDLEEIVRKKLLDSDILEKEDNYDIAIAIGGDGTFLKMVSETYFDSNILYVGINAGTLGFAQEINIDEIDNFISSLKTNNYKIEEIGIEETIIKTETKEDKIYSLNEIVTREKELNTLFLDISIDEIFLEQFVGDGILVSTSFGTTAYNLSFGGSIIFNTFHALEITPIAPLHNKVYKSLINPIIIPEGKEIKIIPTKKRSILLTIDGKNRTYNEVLSIITKIDKKRIKCYRNNNYNFFKKVNDKFLK